MYVFFFQEDSKDSAGGWWRFQQTQVDVLDHFLPETNSFRLTNLTTNTSYVFAMICILWGGHDDDGIKSTRSNDGGDQYASIASNPIFFTTSIYIIIGGLCSAVYSDPKTADRPHRSIPPSSTDSGFHSSFYARPGLYIVYRRDHFLD